MQTRHHRLIVAAILIATAFVLGALRLFPDITWAREEAAVRDIALVARDMAFHQPGEPALNPTLSLEAGSRVRITLRNEEPGVLHSFAIPGWGIESHTLAGLGETRVEFTVPRTKGYEAYQCTPHATMMRGQIVVQ